MDERLPREHELASVSSAGTSEHRRSFSWGLRILACVALACVAVACAVRLGLTVPTWVSWQNRTLSCDLDADGTDEVITLERRRVQVISADGAPLYESDGAWRVSDALVADVTRDGRPELVMLLWRRGNYGNSRPFWERGMDLRMTQHVYVVGLEDGAMQPVWMGHELGEGLKVSQMGATEDGLLELTTMDGQTSVWEWDYFGFSLVE
ncbi:MAG: VCBS repeat-containing protein [Atopobiaceae bacterium]|nr:VCBS repeat-containing protein [Atopobiaceae bacterium]